MDTDRPRVLIRVHRCRSVVFKIPPMKFPVGGRETGGRFGHLFSDSVDTQSFVGESQRKRTSA